MLTAIQIGYDCGMLRTHDDVIIVSVDDAGHMTYKLIENEENERRPSRIALDKVSFPFLGCFCPMHDFFIVLHFRLSEFFSDL